jgi:hypothetical protein
MTMNSCHHTDDITTLKAHDPFLAGRPLWLQSVVACELFLQLPFFFIALKALCTVRVFRQKLTLEDAIGSHACSLEASMRVTSSFPLGWPFSYRFTL